MTATEKRGEKVDNNLEGKHNANPPFYLSYQVETFLAMTLLWLPSYPQLGEEISGNSQIREKIVVVLRKIIGDS